MQILILGGTQFVGRHIVEALESSGHGISVFNRGQTVDELPPSVERLRGDRDAGGAGLAALTVRTWDVCVDVSGYTAVQVRASAELLRGRVGRYVFISAVSVYGNPPTGPVDEEFSRARPAAEDVTELDQETYGRLKVTCENIVQDVYGERSAVLRPQVVAGPWDPYDRFSYWVRRAGEGGEMLAPGDGQDQLQVIDARDVAQFVRVVCEKSLSGAFNLAGPRLTWGEFMTALGATNVVWVPEDVIRSADVTEFELPLYRRDGGPRSGLMHVSNARAVTAGLKLTGITETVRGVRAWLPECTLSPALSREREVELIGRSRVSGV
jgi:2'-hydroxyisoflavone reductase